MIEAVNIHIRIVLVALSTLFTHPCLANYPADNVHLIEGSAKHTQNHPHEANVQA
jgi:hypothetical protein